MEGIHLLRDILQPNDWLGKIDLKDAYFVIPTWRDHRKYLRFVWRQTLLEFACLPFGLAVAPPPPCIYEDHETSSIASTPDRDSTDNLFGRHAPHECVRDRSPARHAYSSILIRGPRFCDQPREILFSTNPAVRISRVSSEHSGYDSAPARLQSEFNQDALFNSSISTRCFSTGTISRLIGKLTASIQAVFPAPLHYRNLQQLKHQALSRDRSFDSRIPLSIEAIDELRWWLAHLDAWNGLALLHPSPDLIIETDASRMGWGAVCQGVRTGGLWSQMEQKLHIDCLELLAGSFAIKSFTKNRLCVHVRLRMDNTSAVVYLNRLGGTRSLVLSNLALALWEWALTRNIFLSAEHIADNLNVSADWESRNFLDSSNWKLCPEIFRSLMQIRGPCTIHLFADRLNCQLPQFCSWKPDPMALATDAFQQNWSTGRNYAFPPFCLIMRFLAKLRAEGGELILVTPVWPTQAWYPGRGVGTN